MIDFAGSRGLKILIPDTLIERDLRTQRLWDCCGKDVVLIVIEDRHLCNGRILEDVTLDHRSIIPSFWA